MIRIINGDVREVLKSLPSDHFDMCLTSPPYWGLRSYLPEGHPDKHREIGLEPTMQGYLETMCGVCDGVWRVLKPEGTFWLNVGDTYAANRGGTTPPAETLAGGVRGHGGEDSHRGRKSGYNPSRDPRGHGLKHKDLCLIPSRLAIMLQERGWYVRSEIIWAKPNPMPESVRDRPTCAHEKVWLLTKSARYFYDADAIREKFADDRMGNPGAYARTTSKAKGQVNDRQDGGFLNGGEGWSRGEELGGRNCRNVWPIASQPYSGAHFATMPPALAERCIKAGCPAGGHVLDPFGGAGTTGLVADRLGRHATLIELNPQYQALALGRVADDAPLFAEVSSP